MKYIDADKLKSEIERRHAYQKEMYSKTKPDGRPNDGWAESLAIMGELEELRNFLDTLEEEPDKSLEEEIRRYLREECSSDDEPTTEETARHFAEWQKEQFEKNRLAHCDAASQEDCDRETDFAMEIIEKEHRHPTFSDAINYGMRLQKEQMLKDAVEGKVYFQMGDIKRVKSDDFENPDIHLGDKVCIIIIKEENK